jgi:hypothetical protein
MNTESGRAEEEEQVCRNEETANEYRRPRVRHTAGSPLRATS